MLLSLYFWFSYCIFLMSILCTLSSLTEDDAEEGVHLVPGSADDVPRTTAQPQDSAGETCSVSNRPSGQIVGIIKRNWHS